MIKVDLCNDCDIRLDRVGRIKASANSSFKNGDVDLRLGKMFQS